MKEDKIHWVYSSESIQQLEDRYDEWASTYETHLEETTGYAIPQETMIAVTKLLDTNAKILDAGAGTGLTGAALAEAGYHELHAIDLSGQMLQIAADKGVYLTLAKMKLGDRLLFDTDSFQGVVITGVFTTGHARPDSLDELVRIVTPGGYIIFSINLESFHNLGFKEKFDELSDSCKWEEAYQSGQFLGLPNYETEVFHQVWGFKVL
tara:strand:+ start:41972 stop:42595 length:624 start_codon:yes stop_codon:yes gene_type:complete